MNTPLFIALKLAINKKKAFSGFIIRLTAVAVTLSVALMIVGSAITRGYQEVIRDKFYDCWGHLHITTFLADPSNLNSDETFAYDSSLVGNLTRMQGIQKVASYTMQSAILKTNDEIDGLLLKGINLTQQPDGMRKYLKGGQPISQPDSSYSTEILISATTGKRLQLNVGDHALLYIISGFETQPRVRKIRIAGIYKTGLEEYDKHIAICDQHLINHLQQRDSNQIHGYEIVIKPGYNHAAMEEEIFERYTKPPLQSYLIEKRFEHVFSWLAMMKMNEQIIILIMMIIAIVNMMTALLILVLERTHMIGLLKAIGMPNVQIRQVFVYASLMIVLIGMSAGTALGIGICLLQQEFGWLKLDETVYYIDQVPIFLDPMVILGINGLTFACCFILLFLPSYIIHTITPIKALRFD
jgi:lipoprotein-releasing system permease protein